MGQQRLRRAVQAYENDESQQVPLSIEWKPFQIDLSTDMQGEDMEAYCRRRWGSSGWTNHLKQEGRKDGASFRNWKWWPNTLRGHQWIQYGVQRHNLKSDDLNARLFTALYEEGANLSSVQTLIKLGQELFPECNEEELRAYLSDNQGAVEVQREIQAGRRQFQIQGVPFFVVSRNGEPFTTFSGAQSSGYLKSILREAATEED